MKCLGEEYCNKVEELKELLKNTGFFCDCPNCEGTGVYVLETWGLPTEECKQCKGFGLLKK